MAIGNGIPFKGYASALGIAQEGTYGTFVTATGFMEFNSEDFKQVREEKKLESINTRRDFTKRLIMAETNEGTLEFDLNVAEDSNVYVLRQALGGTITSATIAAGAYTHTIVPGDMENNAATTTAYKKSLSISIRRGETSASNNIWLYSGCRVDTLSIKGSSGSPVIVSASLKALSCSITSTIPAVSFSTVLPLNFTGITIKTGSSLTSVTTEYFTDFELNVNNNLSEQRALGSRTPIMHIPIKRDVSLKLTQRFDTTTAYDRFISNTLTAFEITCDSGVTIGAVATTYAMIIKIPAGYVNSNNPNANANDVITHELDVSGIYNASLGSDIQFVIRNATASY